MFTSPPSHGVFRRAAGSEPWRCRRAPRTRLSVLLVSAGHHPAQWNLPWPFPAAEWSNPGGLPPALLIDPGPEIRSIDQLEQVEAVEVDALLRGPVIEPWRAGGTVPHASDEAPWRTGDEGRHGPDFRNRAEELRAVGVAAYNVQKLEDLPLLLGGKGA